jgi:hypothetical protein
MGIEDIIRDDLANEDEPPPGVCCLCGEFIGVREACSLFAVSRRQPDALHHLSAHLDCFQTALKHPIEYDF